MISANGSSMIFLDFVQQNVLGEGGCSCAVYLSSAKVSLRTRRPKSMIFAVELCTSALCSPRSVTGTSSNLGLWQVASEKRWFSLIAEATHFSSQSPQIVQFYLLMILVQNAAPLLVCTSKFSLATFLAS